MGEEGGEALMSLDTSDFFARFAVVIEPLARAIHQLGQALARAFKLAITPSIKALIKQWRHNVRWASRLSWAAGQVAGHDTVCAARHPGGVKDGISGEVNMTTRLIDMQQPEKVQLDGAWRCFQCGKWLGEVIDGRLIMAHSKRQSTVRTEVEVVCERCKAVNSWAS